jgi:hypothetical protein
MQLDQLMYACRILTGRPLGGFTAACSWASPDASDPVHVQKIEKAEGKEIDSDSSSGADDTAHAGGANKV